MIQDLFTIPIVGWTVHGYGAMLVLAFVSSTLLASWRARREGLDPEIIYDMAFWLFLGGLAGARIFYVIQYWGRDVDSLWEVVQFWKGGIVYYGGIIGGAFAFLVYRHLRPFPLRPLLDVLAPSIAVGTLFGRLGCFLNGCCFGDPCSLGWGVAFPQKSPPWEHHVLLNWIPASAAWSLPVHPTQLYSALDALILLGLLSAYYPLRRRDGEVMGVLMIAYPVTRFLIEYLRNDEGAFFAGLTISQTISFVLLAGAAIYWTWLSMCPRTRYDELVAQSPEHPQSLVPAGS